MSCAFFISGIRFIISNVLFLSVFSKGRKIISLSDLVIVLIHFARSNIVMGSLSLPMLKIWLSPFFKHKLIPLIISLT